MSSSGAVLTLAGLRDQLPITRHVAYLQTGGHSPTPESVLRTVHDEMAREAEFHGVPAVAAERAEKEARARASLADYAARPAGRARHHAQHLTGDAAGAAQPTLARGR